ncbi:YhcH/YjgK/YiaL family protein [Deminuibacter soli]|uniref:DUF386 domain-containing protein n=1 Tax=Deminuibacter soli TaxID=2291815 RepID=A0A3E1NM48_9BACT|nr:YhcH/YjgK/YiaL family protein [Deminuibacter soli]RFM29006.1 DUF386 domain-containing protein [Deminuibacter soli]
MIIDTLEQAHLYTGLGERFVKAFAYLQQTDFTTLPKGKYAIDGDTVFAMVNEYDTVLAETEQMEAHRAHIDVQYIVQGEEYIGHDFLTTQTPSQAYDTATDFMLFAEKPAFFSVLKKGMFAVFFPTDLHMPNIQIESPAAVKKVVIKIKAN